MKKKLILSIYLLMSFFIRTNAQPNKGIAIKIEKDLNNYFQYYKPEKIYLQSDRNFYYYNDTLYFKTYLINSVTFRLDTAPSIILLDVLDEQKMVKQRFLVKSVGGLGQGSIVLNKYFVTGNCQIVAYTPMMKNYDEDYFFRKNFYFSGSPKVDSLFRHKFSPPLNELRRSNRLAKKIKLQVDYYNFKENAKADLKLRVINKLGIPIETHGFYRSSKTKLSFKTNNEGLARIKNISYKKSAKLELASGKKFKLPAPDNRDLKLSDRSSEIEIQIPLIYTNLRYFAVFSYGNLIKLLNIKDIAKPIILRKDSLNKGVNFLCILNSKLKVLTDMLYFNPLKNRNNIEIEQEAKNIKVKNTIFEKVNLSMSIFYEPREIENRETNIFSQIYVNQELQQYSLYNPETNIFPIIYQSESIFPYSTILQYDWKKPRYVNSDSLAVSGKIIRFLSIGLPDKTIRLSHADDYFSTSVQQTSKNGKFQFSNINGMDSSYYIIDAVKKAGHNNLYIELDTAEYVYPSFKWELAFSDSLRKYKILPENDALNVNIANSEVEILKKKREELRKKSSKGSIYGTPDYVITMNETNRSYPSMKDLFVSIPGVSMNGEYPIIRGITSLNGNNFPLVLVDNVPSTVDILTQMSPYDIDRIEILKSPSNIAMFGSRGANGVIAIFTRKGSFNTGFIKDFTIPGFAKIRPFYSPNLSKIVHRKAYTLLWKPDIELRAGGVISISNLPFYRGAIMIIEGISETGKLIYWKGKIQ